MQTKHTPSPWLILKYPPYDWGIYSGIGNCYDVALVRGYYPEDEVEANARLITAAPDLMQMVFDLKNCISRLTQDNVSQFDRDLEAHWIGEAHEILYNINPDYDRDNEE